MYPVNEICFIINPLGENSFRPHDKIMIDRINKYNSNFYFQLCGYFSIIVAEYFKKYEPDEPFKLVNELFGLKPDNDDI